MVKAKRTHYDGINLSRRYTRREVAEHLNVSYSTVRRIVQSGRLLEESIGGIHRIHGRDLARYIRDFRKQAHEFAGTYPVDSIPVTVKMDMSRRTRQQVAERKVR